MTDADSFAPLEPKADAWRSTIEDLFSKCSEASVHVEEVRGLVEVVSDVKVGLRTQSASKRRHETYKVTKIKKCTDDGGCLGDLSKQLAKMIDLHVPSVRQHR